MKLLVITGRHEGVKVLYPSYKERAAISAPRCSHNGLSRDMLSRLFGTSACRLVLGENLSAKSFLHAVQKTASPEFVLGQKLSSVQKKHVLMYKKKGL